MNHLKFRYNDAASEPCVFQPTIQFPQQPLHSYTGTVDYGQIPTSAHAQHNCSLRELSQVPQEDLFDRRLTPTARAERRDRTQTARSRFDAFVKTANEDEAVQAPTPAPFRVQQAQNELRVEMQVNYLTRQMDKMRWDHKVELINADTARTHSNAVIKRHEEEAIRVTKQMQDQKAEIDVLKRLIAAQEMSIQLLHDLNQASRLAVRMLKPKLEELSRQLAQRSADESGPADLEPESECDVEDEEEDEDGVEYECEYEYEGGDEGEVEFEVGEWISLHSADGQEQEHC